MWQAYRAGTHAWNTRGTPDPAPDLCPRVILICILSSSVPTAKRGSQFTHPSQGMGLTWADPSPGRGPIWAGFNTQEPCTEPLLQSTPALFLSRAGPEHLRAGYGLTNSRSWTGWWPWALLCVASLHQSSRSFHCTHSPGPLSPPTTPPLPDSWVPLLRKRSPWNSLPLMAQKKMIRYQARAAATCPSWPSRLHFCFLHLASTISPIFCNHEPLMGEDWLTWTSRPALPSNAQVEVFINTCLQAAGLPLWLSKWIYLQDRRCGVRKIPWRREWQPTLVFLPEICHGQRILVGYSPWDHKRPTLHLDLYLENLLLSCVHFFAILWTVAHLQSMILCPWDFPGMNTGVGCHSLLQGIFPTQGSKAETVALAGGFFTTEPY